MDAAGSAEARATATAKATVAAFAASEGQGHPRVVEFEKVSDYLFCGCAPLCEKQSLILSWRLLGQTQEILGSTTKIEKG